MNANIIAQSPNDLNGAPQIEDEEHNGLVVHFLQTSKNNEENKIPSHNLQNKIIVHHKVPGRTMIFTNSNISIST